MKRRRPYKKYASKPKLSRGVSQRANFLTCTRKFVLPSWGVTVSQGWQANPFQFRFDSLPNYGEFQSLFDSYRINAVKLTFTPYWDSNDMNQNGPIYSILPRVFTIIDRNGIPAGQINTESKMLEYSRARQIRSPTKPFSIYVKAPAIELASAGDLITSPAVTKSKMWIDTGNPTIPHNGCAIGMILPQGSEVSGFYYHIVATYYLQFKTVV